VRTLNLKRGNRLLPTTVWYPASGRGGSGAPAAAGRFPVVEFSHGLRGLPEYYQSITSAWAAAGFVVAAPTFPKTNAEARSFEPADMVNQPADAWYVLTQVLALDTRTGDPLAGHLDTAHLAAAGHSAGGFTTAGMFGPGHDPRLRAGIVIAGGPMGAFGGAAASMLFIHGDADPVVPLALGQAAYRQVAWPKAFITMVGQGHIEYLSPRAKGYSQLIKATTDLLRAALYGDTTAKRRIGADAAPASTCRIDNHL
jgi:predicted dienelactone hydrolase